MPLAFSDDEIFRAESGERVRADVEDTALPDVVVTAEEYRSRVGELPFAAEASTRPSDHDPATMSEALSNRPAFHELWCRSMGLELQSLDDDDDDEPESAPNYVVDTGSTSCCSGPPEHDMTEGLALAERVGFGRLMLRRRRRGESGSESGGAGGVWSCSRGRRAAVAPPRRRRRERRPPFS